MPRVDLDTYTPPAPALIEHGNSSLRGYASDCVSVAHAEPSTITTQDAGASYLPRINPVGR